MPRKSKTSRENKMSEAMPFQRHLPIKFAPFNGFGVPSIEAAKAALPIFGGTAPIEDKKETDSGSNSGSGGQSSDSGSQSKSEGSAAGGDSDINTDPQAVADLMKQVEALTKNVGDLTKKNAAYEKEKSDAERASLGREEALEKDLEDAQKVIIKMDAALKNQAIVNAINSFREIEFHDPQFARGKLDPSIIENMQVDLENGTVTVIGVENDLRRIAKEFSWAVKVNGQQQSNNGGNAGNGGQQRQAPGRSSGGAPGGGNGTDPGKATTRKALAARFPVITHGRSI